MAAEAAAEVAPPSFSEALVRAFGGERPRQSLVGTTAFGSCDDLGRAFQPLVVEEARASVELALHAATALQSESGAQPHWETAVVSAVVRGAEFTRLTLSSFSGDAPLRPGDVMLVRANYPQSQPDTLLGVVEGPRITTATTAVLLPSSVLVAPGSVHVRILDVGTTSHRRMYVACVPPVRPPALFVDLARGAASYSTGIASSSTTSSSFSSSWITEAVLGELGSTVLSTANPYFAPLDESQRAAAESILANDVSLIQGPPGRHIVLAIFFKKQ